MASIRELNGKNGTSYHVQIRLSGTDHITKTFSDFTTAELWARYKERLLKEKEAFSPDPEHLYTLKDILVMKFGENSREFIELVIYFNEIWDLYLHKMTYDFLVDHAKVLLNKPIRRGGCKDTDTGIKKLPSPTTILRKYAYAASAVNNLAVKYPQIQNNFQKVVTWLRKLNTK